MRNDNIIFGLLNNEIKNWEIVLMKSLNFEKGCVLFCSYNFFLRNLLVILTANNKNLNVLRGIIKTAVGKTETLLPSNFLYTNKYSMAANWTIGAALYGASIGKPVRRRPFTF